MDKYPFNRPPGLAVSTIHLVSTKLTSMIDDVVWDAKRNLC